MEKPLKKSIKKESKTCSMFSFEKHNKLTNEKHAERTDCNGKKKQRYYDKKK